jgi:type I restriction enzyme S subunit
VNIAVRTQVPLGEFMLIRGESTDPSEQPNEPFVLYSIPACDAGQPEFAKGSDIGSPKKNVQSGDVLLSRIIPHIRRSWIVGDHPGQKILASGEWIVFRSDRIHAPYLRHFLVSDIFHQQFMQTVVGVGGSLLRANPNYVAKIAIPFPSLDEQRRIAAVLDKADVLRRARKRGLDLLDKLNQSIFIQTFGNPHQLSTNYPVVEVGMVASCIVPGRDKPKSFTGPIPWITTAELNHLASTNASGSKLGLTPDEIAGVRAKIIPPASVLLTCVGDLGIVSIAAVPMVINQQLHSFQCSDTITPEYLMFALSYQKEYMYKRATKTTLPYMNKSVCNSIPIPLPPVETQKTFGCLIAQSAAIKLSMRASLTKCESAFSSIQSRAFSGHL